MLNLLRQGVLTAPPNGARHPQTGKNNFMGSNHFKHGILRIEDYNYIENYQHLLKHLEFFCRSFLCIITISDANPFIFKIQISCSKAYFVHNIPV